ncbi:MAG: hypothetical protein WCQ44_06455 [Opitutaceae bacterium]
MCNCLRFVGLPVEQWGLEDWPTWVRFILASAIALVLLDVTLMVATLFYQGLMLAFGR